MYSKGKISDVDVTSKDMMEVAVDKQIKHMVEKQLSKNVSVSGHLSNKKSFTNPGIQKDLTTSGLCSLQEFSKIVNENEHVQNLSQLGLSESEIQLKLDADQYSEPIKKKKRRYLIDPIVEKDRLVEIENKIVTKNDEINDIDQFRNKVNVSRHVNDLNQRASENDTTFQLYKCLFNTKSHNSTGDDSDPINNLNSILEESVEREASKEKSNFGSESAFNGNEKDYPHSLWTEIPSPTEEKVKSVPKHFISPSPIEIISKEIIMKYKIPIDEIKKLSKFENYTEGVKSKTLYIKNLSPRVNQDDLIALFHRYELKEDESIVCKLMSGRMRGQAFITFPNEKFAEDALNLVNGYKFKGKPLIAQYGNHNSQ